MNNSCKLCFTLFRTALIWIRFLRFTHHEIHCTNYSLPNIRGTQKWHKEIGGIVRLLLPKAVGYFYKYSCAHSNYRVDGLLRNKNSSSVKYITGSTVYVELAVIVVHENKTILWLPVTRNNYATQCYFHKKRNTSAEASSFEWLNHARILIINLSDKLYNFAT